MNKNKNVRVATKKTIRAGVLAVLCSSLVLQTGCVSFQTDMVDEAGHTKVCEASGGGFGLGALVGVAAAAAMRASCVSDFEDEGYVDRDDAGDLLIDIASKPQGLTVIDVDAQSNASKAGVQVLDIILGINGKHPDTVGDARKMIFGDRDENLELELQREEQNVLLIVERDLVK